ncbi:MAG: hypothetical protein A2664_04805 [Candidatus Taylorbacteria bacterium RIFCSPHIGHO2_01_FULL_46_22b]|uniref:Uncharacterized protein n=1 Tax=Candidatus Taylorbacteria bacterium RIFCSPHIGHO2_01_FULL_46_22b TaxID=1802301 RepID=A0A1G2M4F7_9BACT|nr:MAG: hypothetical protein A2664_04805 [Candidatus Taylorbacteria bacterium RIFCSPHIGHO2_01_FULL_46_22b]
MNTMFEPLLAATERTQQTDFLALCTMALAIRRVNQVLASAPTAPSTRWTQLEIPSCKPEELNQLTFQFAP